MANMEILVNENGEFFVPGYDYPGHLYESGCIRAPYNRVREDGRWVIDSAPMGLFESVFREPPKETEKFSLWAAYECSGWQVRIGSEEELIAFSKLPSDTFFGYGYTPSVGDDGEWYPFCKDEITQIYFAKTDEFYGFWESGFAELSRVMKTMKGKMAVARLALQASEPLG